MDKKLGLEKDFFIIADKDLFVVEILPEREELVKYYKHSLSDFFPEKVFLDEFIKRIDKEGALCKFMINIVLDKKNYTCHLNGYKDKEEYCIFVLFNGNENDELIKAILQLNSKQVNELRLLKKKLNQLDNNRVYEEISKLNSELLNSKRIIEKQNSELKNYNKLLKKMAIEDSLTGCYNRRHFYEYFQEKVLPSQNNDVMSIIMIDFNDFKRVNDEFGHDAGDRLLVLFVQMVKNVIQGKGEIFRFGGDEFVVICYLGQNEAIELAEEISDGFCRLSSIVTIAYGVIEFQVEEINNDFDLTTTLKKVDELMYNYKKQYKAHKVKG